MTRRQLRILFLAATTVTTVVGAATRASATTATTPTSAPPPAATSPAGLETLFVAGGLTSQDVGKRAAATSPDVRLHEAERAAAEAALDQAMAGYLPRLSGGLRYTRLSPLNSQSLGNLVVAPTLPVGPVAVGTPIDRLTVASLSFPVLRNQWSAQATLQVPLSDYILRIPRTAAAASGNLRATELATRAARLAVATEARVAYYAWVRARMQAQVAAQAVAQAQAHLVEVTKAEVVGAASKADVLRVTSQVSAAELLQTRARSLAAICEQHLHTLMHHDSPRRLEIGEDVTVTSDDGGDAVATIDGGGDPNASDLQAASAAATPALWEEARVRRLERRALTASAGALREQARAVRAVGLPRVDAVANLTSTNPHPRVFPQQDRFTTTWDAGLQLSWSPSDVFANEAARRATLARATAVEAQRDALDDALRTQVTQAMQMEIEARSALATAERGRSAAEESYRVRRLLFQNGRATSVEQTDAETELTRARVEAVNARIDRKIAHVRLHHALGRDVDESAPR